MTTTTDYLGLMLLRGLRGGHGSAEVLLLLVGLVFAGLLVWGIERSGKPTT
jgi:hypothetical protein